MTQCTAREERAHYATAHGCVGEQGHAGPHWCLLGHVWTDAEEEAS